MEKRAYKSGMTPGYCNLEFDRPYNMWEDTGGGTGFCFSGGTVVGFFYNFIKVSGVNPNLCTRLGAALANAPRVGGFCAMLTLSTDVSTFMLHALDRDEDNKTTCILACAAGSAIMFSPRGPRSASLAALAGAGFSIFGLGLGVLNTSFSKLHDTNTYFVCNIGLCNSTILILIIAPAPVLCKMLYDLDQCVYLLLSFGFI